MIKQQILEARQRDYALWQQAYAAWQQNEMERMQQLEAVREQDRLRIQALEERVRYLDQQMYPQNGSPHGLPVAR